MKSSKKTLRYASMGRQGCFSSICHHLDITIVSIIMNTTTITGKNKKKSAEMREENVEAIWTIIFLLKTLPMIHWTPRFLIQWEISILE